MSAKPKILQAHNYYYLRGGAERYFLSLIEMLRHEGHDVGVFATKNPANSASPFEQFFPDTFDFGSVNDLSLRRKLLLACRTLYSLESRKRISGLIDLTRPQIAHVHNIYGALSPSILSACKKKGLPVVMTVHDVKMLCPNHRMFIKHQICERCKKIKYYECAINKCLADSWAASALGGLELSFHHALGLYKKNIDIFVTPSEFYKLKMIEYGFEENKILHVPSFIDAEKYTPNFKNDDYLLFFGRLEEVKGLVTLIEAAAKLRDRINIIVAGDGPLRSEIAKRITAGNLHNVKLIGSRSGKELVDIIANSTAVVVPSVWYENCPYVVLESYACGKPVIGSDRGGIPELIDEGRTGFIFEASDADDLAAKMEKMIGNPAVAVEMGKCAREKVVKEFGCAGHYEHIRLIYEKLL